MEEFFRAAGWDLADPMPEDWAVARRDRRGGGADRPRPAA